MQRDKTIQSNFSNYLIVSLFTFSKSKVRCLDKLDLIICKLALIPVKNRIKSFFILVSSKG